MSGRQSARKAFERLSSGAWQAEAQEGSRAAAREGLGRRLREAEARAEALAETVDELRAGLERQRVAADLRCGAQGLFLALCSRLALAETPGKLGAGLERQRIAADLQLLKREMADL